MRHLFQLIRCLSTVVAVAAMFSPAFSQEDASNTDYKRGAYLAAVTGCVGCHSPHDPSGRVLPGRLLAGGDHPIHLPGGASLTPPNITPDREVGIGGWTDTQIVAVLAHGLMPDGRVLSVAMPWRTQFSALSEADMLAIARYILSVPPAPAMPPATPRAQRD